MREFLRGWRRKVGCVTLLMAVLFMGGWIRSLSTCDLFMAPLNTRWMAMAVSMDGTFVCVLWRVPHKLPIFNWQANPLEEERGFDAVHHYDHLSDFEGNSPPQSLPFGPFAYWSIVIPLTLLSTYLILWKPRPTLKPPATGVGFSQRHKDTEQTKNNLTDNSDLPSVNP